MIKVIAGQKIFQDDPSIVISEAIIAKMVAYLENGSWRFFPGDVLVEKGPKQIELISIHHQRLGCLCSLFSDPEQCDSCQETLLSVDFKVSVPPPAQSKNVGKTAVVDIHWCPKCESIYEIDDTPVQQDFLFPL